MTCTGLYYNKERLEELGIDVPTTWEELSDAVDKAKEAGYGGIITYQSAYAFIHFSIRMNAQSLIQVEISRR